MKDCFSTSTADEVDGAAAEVALCLDGRAIRVPAGTVVAAAIELHAPGRGARVSPDGTRRLPLCGMGVCGECRVTIDGRPHRLGCLTVCRPGMEVATDE